MASIDISSAPREASLDLHPNTQITAQNQIQSPLLRLPGEIRNNIYSYAQSGGYCLRVHSWVARPLGSKQVIFNFVQQLGPEETPENKKTRGVMPDPVSWSFKLQLVCRQVASEIDRLAAYRNNIFSFHDIIRAIDFSARLTTEQNAAIMEISIDGTVNRTPNYPRSREPPHAPLRTLFPALKRVYIKSSKPRRPRDHSTRPSLQRLVMDSGFRYQVDSRNSGLEIVRMDVLDDSADYEKAEKITL
ncbi:hypothetical protein K491DRAFT_722465 [Lophiostoma macrostomum CBS 122681]|uniref:DUF7730 domain-containing protein n=1 Tax=Lophiostoma macrostomum CBS 122681 TaxID=1314788 RepID=A0A6A6SQZ7_9PLEO|nr:hypothetical protein K491DRAFT_722465 [Lophiostoma macrostomum CBS 122681]